MRVGWIFLFLLYTFFLPTSLFSVNFKDIVFTPAKASFIVDDEDSREAHTTEGSTQQNLSQVVNSNSVNQAISNYVKIVVRTQNDINQTSIKPEPLLLFYRYDTSSNFFVEIDAIDFLTLDKPSKTSFKQLPPLKLPTGEEIDIGKKIPIAKCLIYKKDEPIFLVYDDPYADKKSLKFCIKSGEDKEVITLKRDGNSTKYVGYINTTTRCKSKFDGKLFVKEGDELDAFLYKSSTNKKSRAISSKIHARAFITQIPKKVTTLQNNNSTPPKVWIDMDSSKEEVGIGEFFKVEIVLENSSNMDISTAKLVNTLSRGAKYIKGSFYLDDKRFDGFTIDKAHNSFSTNLSLKAHQKRSISFVIRNEAKKPRYIINKSLLFYDKQYSNSVTVKVKRVGEFDDSSTITGKILLDGNSSKGVEGVKIYLDSGRYAISDKYGRFHFSDIDPSLHVVSIDPTSIEGKYIAYECRANARSNGSAISRFVDTSSAHIGDIHFCLRENTISSALRSDMSYKIPKPKKITMPIFSTNSFDTFKKKRGFLWPKEDFIPPMPAIKVAFLHQKDDKVELLINGKKVNMLNFDGYVDSKDKKWSISKYRGIDIVDGDNILEMVVKDKSGKEIGRFERKVHFSTSPVKAVIVPEKSYLIADGKNPPVIAVKMYDASGHPLRRGVTGTFELSNPYISMAKSKLYEEDPLLERGERNRFIILDDGIAYIELMPTTVTGEVKLHFEFQEPNQYLTTWLTPKNREWLLVGFAEGSIGYQEIKKDLKKVNSKELLTDGKVSLFAKGTIGKDTLLTIAYKSGRNSKKEKEFIDKDAQNSRQFTIYGDNAIDQNEAPTSKKLYLKIEKEQFYAMFGDFETGLDKLELSRYSRRVTGIKSEYHGDSFEYTAFASNTSSGFKRVEIVPDGTSGPYKIKTDSIYPGSEKVYIEIRDRYRGELVLDKRGYAEIYDYSIDYQNGLIYFKEPIASRDRYGNPQTIVVEYELGDEKRDRVVAGGRATIKFAKDRAEVGVSTIAQENADDEYDTLYGADFKINLLKNLVLNGEYATTKKASSSANAYLVEMEHFNKFVHTKAYIRHQERDFGLGFQNNSLAGSNRYGIDSTISYFDNFLIALSYHGEKGLKDNRKRDTLESKLIFNRGGWMAIAGYRFAKDTIKKESDLSQIISALQKRFFHGKVGLSLAYEKSIAERSNYQKDRVFGELSYRVTNTLELFVNHEMLEGKTEKERASKIGLKGMAWRGATIQSGITQKLENDENRLFGFLGLNQYYRVNKKLSINAALENQKSLDSNNIQKDYTSYSIGANYKHKKWIFNTMLEYKDGFQSDKLNINFGAYTELNRDLGFAMGIRENISNEINSTRAYDGEAKFSIAYRGDSAYTLLSQLKIDHRKDRYSDSKTVIAALKGVINPSNKSQISSHYAIKINREKIDNNEFSTTVDAIGLEAIYDLSKKIEIGVNGSLLHIWESGDMQESYGGYLGYSFFKNLYLGVGYNFKGYYDKDLSTYLNSAEGAYLKMRMKLDNESLDQLTKSF